MNRLLKHLLATPLAVRRAFPPASLEAIEREIALAEREYRAEIRFAVEAALDVLPLLRGQTARARALEVFSELRVWDTEQNNGVLVYLLLADRDVEIVADRGLNARVDAAEWTRICLAMEKQLAAGRYEAAVLEAIRALARLLAQHFPAQRAPAQRQPDRPVLIG